MDRRWTFGTERCPTVSVDGLVAFGPVLRTARRKRVESETDAAPGRAVHAYTFLRRSEDDGCTHEARLCRQSKTSPATTAADGPGSDLSKTESVGPSTKPSHLSIPAAPRRHHTPESSVVERYHVYPSARRFHLSRRSHRLVQPLRAELGNIDEPGCRVLLLGPGPSAASGSSRNLQHRPGSAIHERGIHQQTRSRRHRDQHGWARPGFGQRFCRTAVEDSQIRRRLSQGLQRSPGRGAQSWTILQLLQWPASASSAGLSNAGSRLLRHSEQDKEAASRQLLLMSFKGMRKSIRTMEAPSHKADASAHLSDEFPAGYSSTRCSPAVLVSASPAEANDASGLPQLRGIFNNERSRTEKPEPIHRQRSTLTDQFFCPKNGEYLRHRDQHGWAGPGFGQRFCRTAVENGQIRRRLSQGLQRSPRRGAQSWTILQLLQWPTSASSAGLSNAGSRLLRHSEEDKEAASRQLLLMVLKA